MMDRDTKFPCNNNSSINNRFNTPTIKTHISNRIINNPIQRVKLPNITFLFCFLVISFDQFPSVKAQQLHQVYMVNHRTASTYHAFSRIDRASLIEAIENMGLAAFPCGVELLNTRNEISSIVFHFQLYKACPSTDLQKDEDPIPLLNSKHKDLIKNNSRVNFNEMVKGLQDTSIFDQQDVTFMKEDATLKKVVNLHEPTIDESRWKDIASLRINFTSNQQSTKSTTSSTTPPISRQKRALDLMDLKSINLTAISYANKLMFLGNNEDDQEPDLDYYAAMTEEDIEIEAVVLMESLKSSKFADEGCVSQRLQPMDTVRALKPFSGDGYIINEVLGEVLNMVKNKPQDHYLININYRPIKCFTLCTTSTPLTTSSSVCGGTFDTNQVKCVKFGLIYQVFD